MALTFTQDYVDVQGSHRVWVGVIDFDNDYEDNGEAITAANFDFDLLKDVIIDGIAIDETNDLGLGCTWDKPSGKIRLFTGGADGDPFDEADDQLDVSAYAVRVRAYGW